MNKWKIGFGICLALLIGMTFFSLYYVVDQGVSLAYLSEGYKDTEKDLNTLVELINDTDLTKGQIEEKLMSHELYEFMDFNQNKIHLNRGHGHFITIGLKKLRNNGEKPTNSGTIER